MTPLQEESPMFRVTNQLHQQYSVVRYASIEDLPMKLFLRIIKNEDLSILGFPTKEENEKVWSKMLEEYKKLDPDNEFSKVLDSKRDMEYHICRYEAINIAIHCLSTEYNEELVAMLASHGYIIRKESYDPDLIKAKKFSESIKIVIKEIEDSLKKESQEGVMSFEKIIIKFNTVMGFKIADTNSITVTEYYALKEEVSEKAKSMKSKNNERRR